MSSTGPLAMFSGMRRGSEEDDSTSSDTYPGSKKKKRSVTGEPTDPWHDLPYTLLPHKGERVRFYDIGVLAKLVGRDTQTVRKWEVKGYLPRGYRFPGKSSDTKNRKEGQRRVYTREQIEGLVLIAKRTGVMGPYRAGVKNVKTSGFPELSRELFEELKR